MLTLITGVPGSGKTLYTVANLLPPMLNASVDVLDDDGNKTTHKRAIYTNVKNLQLDHDLIDADSLNTWHTWAKPGAFIVFDEVQKVWPQMAVGSKVPEYIAALETHRHMGVDMVLLTQGPHLVHRNLLALVGRHLHVRRVGNMNLAIVYEWDHCSRSLLYKNAVAKKAWRFDKSAFKLYRSADAHTKQPRSVPAVIWGIAAACAALAYLTPTFYTRFTDRAFNAQASTLKVPAGVQQPAVPRLPSTDTNVAAHPQAAPAAAPASAVSPPLEQPQQALSGCISTPKRCDCYAPSGYRVKMSLEACRSAVLELGQAVPLQWPAPSPQAFTPAQALNGS